MENIIDILEEYKKLDTTVKKENFVADGFEKKSRRWEKIYFKLLIEDINETFIFGYPINEKGEKSDHEVYIHYHKTAFFQKFPIVARAIIRQIRAKSTNDILEGVASLEEMEPMVILRLKELTQ
ncbi:MAG TPA: hypothetical protein PKH79_02605 [Prolixibacteraceae bacterium]|nr:hypothetical protein [Prolixibacteraceae bacterium]HPS12604.1 hypothetical protein [Prolixibacteraceae bacterium]